MRYLLARLEDQTRERGYRIYVTDVLRVAFLNEESARYADQFKPLETRTAEEIKQNIIGKIGELNGSV